MTFRISDLDLDQLTDVELEPLTGLANELRQEQQPRSKALSIEEFRVFSNFPGSIRRRRAAYTADGQIAALLSTSFPDDGTNPGVLSVDIKVARQHRRRGLATQLLAVAAETAEELGRSKITGSVFDTVPAALAFSDAVGASGVLEMHMNSLAIPDLDIGLLKRWVDEGPRRAPDYSVEIIEGDWPDDLIERMGRLFYILERDSPTPEGYEPREWSPDRIRQMQQMFAASTDGLLAVAIHTASGEPVGMSHLLRRNNDPTTWQVTFTIVDDLHRGHALGKWVKGAVNVAALERWEGGEYAETTNAYTNEAMLGINHEMGFSHEYTMTEVEASLETVRSYLSGRI